jgi:hypothetical protein
MRPTMDLRTGGAEKTKRSVLTVPPTMDRTDGLNKVYSWLLWFITQER